MNVNDTIISERGFWELNHANNQTKWLTGTDAREVLRLFDISPTDKDILDIGVGDGNMTRHLYSTNNRVYGVDISCIALDKIKKYCQCTFTTEQLPKLESNSKGCAICFLVFQHCQDDVVKFIFEHVYRSLGSDCKFYFQFASIDSTEYYEKYMGSDDRSHIFFRSISDMEKLLSPIPFKITNTKVFNTKVFNLGEFNVTWHLCVINKI